MLNSLPRLLADESFFIAAAFLDPDRLKSLIDPEKEQPEETWEEGLAAVREMITGVKGGRKH